MATSLDDLVAVLRSSARRLLSDLDDAERQLDLAAHAYSIACTLVARGGPAKFAVAELLSHRQSLAVVAKHWSTAKADGLTASSLYSHLIDTLKIIEAELARVPAVWESLPAFTKLGASHPLHGEVVHRFCRINALKRLREQRERDLPLLLQAAEHPSHHLDQLRMHWNDGHLQPEIQLPGPFPLSTHLVWDAGARLSTADGFRFLLCPLAGSSVPQFEVLENGRIFRALGPDSVTSRDELHDHLIRIIEFARQQEVHMVVLPELMVCEATRTHLKQILSEDPLSPFPYGVVAGSFHVWNPAASKNTLGVFNESVLVDHDGRHLLAHQKRGKFSILPSVVAAFPEMFPRGGKIPEDAVEVLEGIDYEGRFELLETSLGRIAVAICADCIVPDHTSILTALKSTRPDLLVIVAMTPETNRFEAVMTDLAEAGTSSLLVNAQCMVRLDSNPPPKSKSSEPPRATGEAPQLPWLAAASLALGEPEGAPPTRIRWRYGMDEPEVRYFKPKDRNKSWRPASQCHQTGVSLSRSGTEALGLLIDLQPHERWANPKYDTAGPKNTKETARDA